MTGSRPAHADSTEQLAWLEVDKGRTALLRGQYVDAAELLTAALRSHALSYAARALALGNRGVVRWRLRELRSAIDDFNEAISLVPEDAALYNNRGNVLLELGHAEEAAKDFGQAIALSPFYAAAYSNRGNARFLVGEYEGALADFTVAIGLMPDNAAPFNGRGMAQLALRRPAGALRDFSRAVALKESYAQAYANRAKALVALDRYEDAVADYTSAVKLGMATAKVFLGRGSAYALMNRPQLAIADFGRAAKLDLSLQTANTSSLVNPGRLQTSDPARPPLARAALSSPTLPAPLPCDGGQHAAEVAPDVLFSKVADASSRAVPSSLIYRTDGTASGILGRDQPDPGLQSASPCNAQSGLPQVGAATSTQLDGKSQAAPETEAWAVTLNQDGEYVATLMQRPAVRFTLEMYGEGEPELLHWQLLRGSLGNIGLLHYYAGRSPAGERLEYIALIDTASGKLIAIEPCQFGAMKANWTWGDGGLVVVDPQGIPSRVQLRIRVSYEKPAHVKRIKHARRHLPPRFAHKGRKHMSSPHFAYRSLPYHARMSSTYRGYPPYSRYGLK